MLEAYSKGITIPAASAVTFSNAVPFDRRNDVELSGTGTIVLNNCGIYELVFDGVVQAGTSGDIQFQVLRNGVELPQAAITITGATTATGIPFSVRTFVKGPERNCCRGTCGYSPVVIQINNIGVEVTGDVHITVDRELN